MSEETHIRYDRWLDMPMWGLAQAVCLATGRVPPEDEYWAKRDGNPLKNNVIYHDALLHCREGTLQAVEIPASDPRLRGLAGSGEYKVKPLVFIEWWRTQGSLPELPEPLTRYYESHHTPVSTENESSDAVRYRTHPHGNTETNALRREQLLGLALWCIHSHYDKCTDKKGKLSANSIAVQMKVMYDEAWKDTESEKTTTPIERRVDRSPIATVVAGRTDKADG